MTSDELRALADEATPGPWTIRMDGIPPDEDRIAGLDMGKHPKGGPEDSIETDGGHYGPELRNARLIAALGPDAARLLADAMDTLAYGLPPIEHAHIVSAFTGKMEGRCRTCEIHELLARFAKLGTHT